MAEYQRLDRQAKLIGQLMSESMPDLLTCDQFFTRPDPGVTCILDTGCGTGLLTELLANAFPQAAVYGLDLTPMPSGVREVKTNLQFLQGNILTQAPDEWISVPSDSSQETNTHKGPATSVSPFPDQTEALFDFMFSRLLTLGMNDWPRFLATEFRLLKPGGRIEVQEYSDRLRSGPPDDVVLPDHPLWDAMRRDGYESQGIDFSLNETLADHLRTAGFVNVQEHHLRIPMTTAAATSDAQLPMVEFYKKNVAFGRATMFSLGWTKLGRDPAELERMIRSVQRDIFEREGRVFCPFIVVTAQKPSS